MSKKIRGFAHLFGFGANASEDNDDENEKSKKTKGRRAEDDDKDPGVENDDDKDKSKKSKSNRTEDDDNPDDDDEGDDKSKKGRRAEDDSDDEDADDGDDDGDDEDENRDVKKGRRAERNRISRILGSKHAAGKGPLAVSLAITTGMSSAAAIRVMATSGPMVAPQARRRSLDERMSSVENHQLGNDAPPASGNKSTLVNHATSLYNQVKGKK
ncbi:MAG: DNA primase [Serratia proteamaculans]